MIEHPQRWHIYIVDLEPRIGTKPGKQRPCLAIQPSEFAEFGLGSTVVLPLTTKVARENAFPLRVRIPKGTCKIKEQSEILIDQILAWDHQLFQSDLGEIPLGLQAEVSKALREFLDL